MKPGDLLSARFEIEQQTNVGSMGEVFRARDHFSGEVVAVKILFDDRAHRAARFTREIDLLAELSHPGIVRYIFHGTTPAGELFFVMEWLDGEDLKARLERASLTMSEAVTLATCVAQALGAAHARGIVHRDLKPSNLFLPAGHIDQVKVLDFGIAHKHGRSQLTQTGTAVGTPGYMAPEQARSNGVIDARADVFALGCVLFQCLTGAPPFEGVNAIAILAKILFDEAPRVSALWPEVPEALDALVAQTLAKEPAQRPSDGANLAAALAALGPQVHSAAVAPRAQAVKPSAITVSERRFLSLVLVGSAAEDDALAEDQAAALRRAANSHGDRVEQLADGSTIVMFEADWQVATDQAARAARCALALRAAAHGRPITIATGRAESQRRLPAGDVIDRASRVLAHMASAPEDLPPIAPPIALPIALDDVSAGLLDARFDVIERDAGLWLHGERPLMQGARALLGRPTPYVGRDWELGLLTGILDECINEPEARVAIVTAAAGMGKSRLGAEFVSRVQQRSEEVAIWMGRGDSLRSGSMMALLAQALRGALGIQGGEPLPERRNKIRLRVSEHVPASEQRRVTVFLGELIGAPFPGDEAGASLVAARQDPQLMSEQMRRAWLDFLDAETSAHPVLLLLEDLHWGDFGTVRFIDTALRDRGERPWMVLALARPELYDVFPRLWAERQSVQQIRLKELARKAGERLVRQVLGETVSTQTMERLVKQADGNTFYLEELIRAAAEGKDDALPETVLAMVETRLARLAAPARWVLRAASVFGEICWENGVTVLIGGVMGKAMVSEWLTILVEQEVLMARPDGRFPQERELRFRHALLREGAYATLTDEDRQLGHRVAGEWLEQHGEDDPMVLAGHFERGGQGARAAHYYLRASEQAFHVLDLDATIARAALGLDCAPPLELRIALLGMRCEASAHGVHVQRIGAMVTDAEELMRSAPRGSIPWAQAMNAYIAGTMLAGRPGDLLAAITLLREVDPIPEAVGRMVIALLASIYMLDNLGHVTAGTALEERFLAVIRSTVERELLARLWWNITIGMRAAYAHDDPWTALQHSDAIQTIFEVIGGERTFLNMQLFRGLNLWYLGAFAAADRTLGDIAAADEDSSIGNSLRRFGLTWLRADRGALDHARVLATQLSEDGQAHHNPLEEGRGRWVLAEVLRRMGDLEGAERELDIALGLVMPLEHPGALGTRSALHLAQGHPEAALAAAREAVARWKTMGGCGMFRGAFVRLVHAEALHATGAHDAARLAIAQARTHLFDIAQKIGHPEYRTSFLENVPENARTLALARAWLDP